MLLSMFLVELEDAFVRLQRFAIVFIYRHARLTELFHGLDR